MELSLAELELIERNAEQVLALTDELRARLEFEARAVFADRHASQLVPAIRTLQSVRCQVQDLENQLGDVLTGPAEEVELRAPTALHWRK